MSERDYVQMALQYARDVVEGRVVAGKLEIAACKRQLDDLQREVTEDWPWVFDAELAARPCEFIELLPHIKGKWARERRKITLEGWQCFSLTTVFGWVHHETGLRRFLEVYEEVARKNAKSTKCAGIALYMLGADGEAGAEVYTAATTRDQARIVFDDAKSMAEREPEMRAALGLEVMQHVLVVPGTASKLAPLAAEGSTLDGLNVHCAIVDEVHAHKRRDVYDVLDTARGAREQSLLWLITTAGSDRSGIGYERRGYAVKVLNGTIRDDRVFALIYTIDDGDDALDPTVWRKANPNFGVSVLPEEFAAAARKASETPSAMANFLTKRLNVWVNADSAWMDMRAWDRCGDTSLTLDSVKHLPCWVGLDLASKVDIAAKVRVFRDRTEDKWYVLGDYYLPERAVTESRNSQYDGWYRRGLLHVTPGEVTDYDQIEEHILNDHSTLDVQEVPFDPHNAVELVNHMNDAGVPMVEMRPTVLNFSEPMKTLEALVLQGKLVHNGDPVLTWMVSNVVCHLDAKDNIYPRKERPENKIDGVVALIMAIGRALAGGESAANLDAFLDSPLVC